MVYITSKLILHHIKFLNVAKVRLVHQIASNSVLQASDHSKTEMLVIEYIND